MEYGFLSLLPPVVAIALAIWTRQVFVSLLFGIWLGYLIIAGFNPLQGSLDTIEALVDVFQDKGSTRTILFSALVGALIVFVQRSGGVEGFIRFLSHRIEKLSAEKEGRNRVLVQFMAWVTGLIIFVESSISVLTVGTIYRPMFDKLKISREKLAFIADSSSAPSCIIFPFNAWGAFIMSLLVAEGISQPFLTLFESVAFNFYPVLALGIVLIVILRGKDLGPMKEAEIRVNTTGELLNPGAQPMVSEELTAVDVKPGITPRMRNMLIPIAVMVLMMPFMLAFTGWQDALAEFPEATGLLRIGRAIGQGSGSTSVLVSVLTSIMVSIVLYSSQRMFSLKETVDMILKGISEMMPLALLMLFAFAIGNVCKNLETGLYIAEVTRGWLSPALLPFLVFVISCFIAFSTGTSFGTFGIMMHIAIPIAVAMDAPLLMTVAAVMGGGVFGDHCSPISDTTILSSMAAATDHIDHVRTQAPYALIAGGITAILYLVIGLVA
ncbi:MAG: sodium:solute symporter [Saprospiraceae bacterium]|nr:sodium:solute symporter [Saprospiraceae bacterium]MCB9321231.1 sodium:solute symporter [Lewinellaceae bacterium]